MGLPAGNDFDFQVGVPFYNQRDQLLRFFGRRVRTIIEGEEFAFLNLHVAQRVQGHLK